MMKVKTIDEVRERVSEIQDDDVKRILDDILRKVPTASDITSWLSSPLNGKSLDINLRGNVPVILTAPHGGTSPLGSVKTRSSTSTPSFRKIGDRNTGDLVRSVSALLATRYNVRPFFVISNVHRKYVDLNRPVSTGCEEQTARLFHQVYHSGISTAIQICKGSSSSIKPLLLDIHGHDRATHEIYRGTQNGKTSIHHDCECGHPLLLSLHRNSKLRLHPVERGASEMSGFKGGWTVQAHGLTDEYNDGIDAIQLEFALSYRKERKAITSTAVALAAAIADHVGAAKPV
eukprot:TRINITY_DN11627_c0_g1_i1.p1 TRINITY_DN11627_c0_g1~~TRINITY_DN11627_c0_g1_i1.p1  ORF type:complete len:335 (+),score=41.55 TRINITY_DN11627_c0_g1_i1:139-1005(+)